MSWLSASGGQNIGLPHRIISRLRFPSLAVSVLGLPTFRVSGPLSPSPPRGGSPVHASVRIQTQNSLQALSVGGFAIKLLQTFTMRQRQGGDPAPAAQRPRRSALEDPGLRLLS